MVRPPPHCCSCHSLRLERHGFVYSSAIGPFPALISWYLHLFLGCYLGPEKLLPQLYLVLWQCHRLQFFSSTLVYGQKAVWLKIHKLCIVGLAFKTDYYAILSFTKGKNATTITILGCICENPFNLSKKNLIGETLKVNRLYSNYLVKNCTVNWSWSRKLRRATRSLFD